MRFLTLVLVFMDFVYVLKCIFCNIYLASVSINKLAVTH